MVKTNNKNIWIIIGIIALIAFANQGQGDSGTSLSVEKKEVFACMSSDECTTDPCWFCTKGSSAVCTDRENDKDSRERDGYTCVDASGGKIGTCSETDIGADFFKRGTTSGTIGTFSYSDTDFCSDSSGNPVGSTGDYLVEHSCDGDEELIFNTQCANGCEDGACKPTPGSQSTCSDSDGGLLYSVKGSTSGMFQGASFTNTDHCVDSAGNPSGSTGTNLKEFYCSGDEEMVANTQCANGCENGKCKADISLCPSNADIKILTSTFKMAQTQYISGDVVSFTVDYKAEKALSNVVLEAIITSTETPAKKVGSLIISGNQCAKEGEDPNLKALFRNEETSFTSGEIKTVTFNFIPPDNGAYDIAFSSHKGVCGSLTQKDVCKETKVASFRVNAPSSGGSKVDECNNQCAAFITSCEEKEGGEYLFEGKNYDCEIGIGVWVMVGLVGLLLVAGTLGGKK